MICPYCHGQAPSTDGITECGWCRDGHISANRLSDLSAALHLHEQEGRADGL